MGNTFDDKQLEELLKNMPKINDHQDPEQLFTRVSSRLHEERKDEDQVSHRSVPKRKKAWLLPTIASLAALLLLALVTPTFLYNEESSVEHTELDKNGAASQGIVQEDGVEEEVGIMSTDENISLLRMAPVQTQVINEIGDNEQIITVAIPDRNAQVVVPISFVVPKDETSVLEKVGNIKEHLQEAEWGLSKYILEPISLEEKQTADGLKKVVLNVPSGHPYGNGSAMEFLFLATIEEIFKPLAFSEIEFQTEGEPGIDLGNHGIIKELSLANAAEKRSYYIYQPADSSYTYLLPVSSGDADVKKAIEAMRNPNEYLEGVKPSIPEHIGFERIVSDDTKKSVTIELEGSSQLENSENDILMIEALLMTAKEYGYTTVEFKNLNNTSEYIGPYLVTEPLQVPMAVNPMPY